MCIRDREHTAPQRLVTTTVAVKNGLWARLPVRSRRAVPKDKVKAICKLLRHVRVTAPVVSGAIIWTDAAEPGIEIIASRDMPAR